MPTKYDNRRRKLERLIAGLNGATGKGGIAAVARKTGLANSTLHHALHEKPVNPSAGTPRRSHTHQLGDGAAQEIEVAFGLAKGWLSEPLTDDLVPGPGHEGRKLLAWIGEALESGVMSEVDATLELAKLADLYPGASLRPTSQATDMAAASMHLLVLGTTGAGKTDFFGALRH